MQEITCPKCEGARDIQCPACKGLGDYHGMTCVRCIGSGAIICPRCKGKGAIRKPASVIAARRRLFESYFLDYRACLVTVPL
jgi:DnaJ-class molecular chaperone